MRRFTRQFQEKRAAFSSPELRKDKEAEQPQRFHRT